MGHAGNDNLSRRTFLKSAALAGAGSLAARDAAASSASPQETNMPNQNLQVPRRPFGKTGEQVSILGVGGFHLGSAKDQQAVNTIVGKAIDAGVNFFDNAWEYHDGDSEERLGIALQGKRDKVILMTKVCTHGRDKSVAMDQLEQSLRRLRTDHLDVWQIHEVVYYNDPDLIFAPNGAAEAYSKPSGRAKSGFSGSQGIKILQFI